MPIKRPKVLIIFSKEASEVSTRFGGFVKRIQRNGGFQYADVDYVALEKLVFQIKNKNVAQVYDPVRNIDVRNYSFVYFKSWQLMPEVAASVAHFLEAKGIPYADHQVRHEYTGKAVNYMTMWAQGVSVPDTVWAGSCETLIKYIESLNDADFPLIVKANNGQKGRDNYLVKSREEALSIIQNTPVDMLVQKFIRNNGDWRIGVYGHVARWAIYRQNSGASHLNNTSAGGVATNISINKVPLKVRQLAEAAADACDLAISGVDVVEDIATKRLYVLEANQGSQIVTGAFTDTNMTAFDEGMKSMVVSRLTPAKRRLQTIGRIVEVKLKTDEGDITLRAKVDSGAFQSAVHAEDIVERTNSDGIKYLDYAVVDPTSGVKLKMSTSDFGSALVYTSMGHADRRFVVPVVFEIGGKRYNTRVTLADRSSQKNPVLIGRQLLRGNFIINVEIGA